MKISCPGCGKVYQVPQSLIDAILEKHGPKAAKPDVDFFRELAAAPMPVVVAHPVNAPKPGRSIVKITMLVLTILWPIAVLGGTVFSFISATHGMVKVGSPPDEYLFNPATGVTGTAESFASTAILSSLFGWTLLWMLAMAFLGMIRLTTRK